MSCTRIIGMRAQSVRSPRRVLRLVEWAKKVMAQSLIETTARYSSRHFRSHSLTSGSYGRLRVEQGVRLDGKDNPYLGSKSMKLPPAVEAADEPSARGEHAHLHYWVLQAAYHHNQAYEWTLAAESSLSCLPAARIRSLASEAQLLAHRMDELIMRWRKSL